MINKVLYCIIVLSFGSLVPCTASEADQSAPAASSPSLSEFRPAQLTPGDLWDIACGPVSILNALHYGGVENRQIFNSLPAGNDSDRLKEIVTTYGAKRSGDYDSGPRFRADGISGPDLASLYNDLRSQYKLLPLASEYLNRAKSETAEQHLRRIHLVLSNSIKSGNPPIIQIRSQAARWFPKDGQFEWTAISAHFITVVRVSELSSDGSFVAYYIEPSSEKNNQLVLFDDPRSFIGAKGVALPSEWLKDSPFVAVAGGSLSLLTHQEPWCLRSVVYLHYAIYAK